MPQVLKVAYLPFTSGGPRVRPPPHSLLPFDSPSFCHQYHHKSGAGGFPWGRL